MDSFSMDLSKFGEGDRVSARLNGNLIVGVADVGAMFNASIREAISGTQLPIPPVALPLAGQWDWTFELYMGWAGAANGFFGIQNMKLQFTIAGGGAQITQIAPPAVIFGSGYAVGPVTFDLQMGAAAGYPATSAVHYISGFEYLPNANPNLGPGL
jgi:hypothetical protein